MVRTVTIYLLAECPGCGRARRLARELRERRPDVRVELHDLAEGGRLPPQAVGVPAWLLDGRLFSHGNPALEQLLAALGGG